MIHVIGDKLAKGVESNQNGLKRRKLPFHHDISLHVVGCIFSFKRLPNVPLCFQACRKKRQ